MILAFVEVLLLVIGESETSIVRSLRARRHIVYSFLTVCQERVSMVLAALFPVRVVRRAGCQFMRSRDCVSTDPCAGERENPPEPALACQLQVS